MGWISGHICIFVCNLLLVENYMCGLVNQATLKAWKAQSVISQLPPQDWPESSEMEFSFKGTAKWFKLAVLHLVAMKGHWSFLSLRNLPRSKDYYYSYYLLIRRTLAEHELNYSCLDLNTSGWKPTVHGSNQPHQLFLE